MDNEQLVARIQAGINEADHMLILWQQNQKFIRMLAVKYAGYAELDDLIQEGYFGLCEAVRHYDPDQEIPFINYAAFWIRQGMKRYIENCCGVIRIPVHAGEWVRKYKRIIREYQKYYGSEPSESALCALLGVSREKLHDIQKASCMGQIKSLSEPLGDEEGLTLADAVSSDEVLEEDCIERLDTAAMKRDLWEAVDGLEEQQQKAIKYRYREGMTLKETGKAMGVGIERARQMERKAMRTLRSPGRCRKFKGYYEEYLQAAAYHHVGLKQFQDTWLSEVEREALKMW